MQCRWLYCEKEATDMVNQLCPEHVETYRVMAEYEESIRLDNQLRTDLDNIELLNDWNDNE
jgi:hypothetical protein